jgi:broad specificity phosphatase PhoE
VTRLVLVRHGETVWHAENRYAGRSDVALTPRGHEQAERLAEWAVPAELDAIWCSPLSRARETAAAPARASGLEPNVDPRLRELDFGSVEGLTTAEMRQQCPEELEAFQSDPVANHLPGGEDPRDAVARAVACLHDIARGHPAGRVLVVAHTTLIRLTLCHLIGVPIANYRKLLPFVRNVGLTEIRLVDGGTSLLQYNAPLDLSTAVPVDEPASATQRTAGSHVAARSL